MNRTVCCFFLLAAVVLCAGHASAAPMFRFVDNGNGTGELQLKPDASLFETAAGGSMAFEALLTTPSVSFVSADNAPDFPRANPGTIGGSLFNGLRFSAGRIRASFGSDLFTVEKFVPALVFELGGPARVDYEIVFAQNGLPFNAVGSGRVTVPEPASTSLLVAAAAIATAARRRR